MNKFYIHKDKTVEIYGTNPIVTEMELLNVCQKLSEIEDPELTELHAGAPWNQPCVYCDSTEHKWENCPDANDELYDNEKGI